MVLPALSQAQDDNSFGLQGGFGGPTISCSLQSSPTLLFGGEGAMLFSNGLFIGGYGQGTSSLMQNELGESDFFLETEHGGPWTGYFKSLGSGWAFSGSLKVGFGAVQLVNYDEQHIFYDKTIVYTPEIALYKRVGSVMSVEIGAGYSIFTQVDLEGVDTADFSSPTIFFALKFGGGYL